MCLLFNILEYKFKFYNLKYIYILSYVIKIYYILNYIFQNIKIYVPR